MAPGWHSDGTRKPSAFICESVLAHLSLRVGEDQSASELNQSSIRAQSELNQSSIRAQSERNQSAIRAQSELTFRFVSARIKARSAHTRAPRVCGHLVRPVKQ